MGKFIDITGNKYNRLTVLKIDRRQSKHIMWLCKCDCGNTTAVQSGLLKSGHTKSCGCLLKEVAGRQVKTHGLSRFKGASFAVYRAWLSMKDRCLNPKCKDYYLYGGRGIDIFEEWINNFKSFYDYMGDKPTNKHSIDRFPDKNGNYEPGNVRWATQKQQGQNVRRNVVISFGDKTMVLSEWARHLGVTPNNISYHLKNGRTMEQIVAHYKYKKDNPNIKWMPFLFPI